MTMSGAEKQVRDWNDRWQKAGEEHRKITGAIESMHTMYGSEIAFWKTGAIIGWVIAISLGVYLWQ